MSLFSRIDRIRGGGRSEKDGDDDSVFAIPNLSQAPSIPAPPPRSLAVAEPSSPREMRTFVPSPLSPGASEAPVKRLSPLERLAMRTSDMDEESEGTNGSGSLPDPVVPERPSMSQLLERLKVEPLPDDVASPIVRDEIEDEVEEETQTLEEIEDGPLPDDAAPEEEMTTPIDALAHEEHATFVEASLPSRAEEVAAPATGGTAFDRLMAARAGANATSEAPKAGAPSLAERLAAMRANAEVAAKTKEETPATEAQVPLSARDIPFVAGSEVVFDPETRLEDVLAPEPVEIEEAPAEPEIFVESGALDEPEFGEPETANSSFFASTALPVSTLDSMGSDLNARVAFSSVEAAPFVEEAPVSFVPAEIAPPIEASVRDVPVAPPLPWESPAPEVRVSPPLPSIPGTEPLAASVPTSSWAQRLAGRDGLRDVPVANLRGMVESAPASAAAPETTEAIDRAPGGLARIGGEGVAGEAEARNRALYRQKHFVFDAVLGSLDGRALQNPTRDSVKAPIERAVDAAIREFNLSLDNSDRNWMIEEFVREVVDLGPLVGLLDDVTVNKILVVGSTDVAVERFGRIERTGICFRDDDHLLSVVRRIADLTGGRIDAKVPLLDRPLPDGARIRAKIPPLAPQPTLTVEKSTGNPFTALRRQQSERGRENALPYAQLRERIQQRLLREFEGNAAALANPERLRSQVEEMIGLVIAEEKVAVSRAERASLVMDLLNEIVGLGPIEPLLNDPDVDEVMVNGPFQIYVERKGKLEIAPQRFRDNAHVMQVIERIVAPLGRRVDEKSPMVDGRLRDGSRFNAIIPPLSLSGPTMTIRKFARDPFTMTDLINFGSLSREAAQFLQAAVEGRMNIIVSGGTGSGKTTTLNVLSSFIPSTERIVTIEDAAELQLRQEHVIRLETRPANIEGSGEITIRDLVRNCLRMRPDRIVVGECRGGEALDMLQAMNTGHDGSLTTGHSNGPRDTVKRLETMVMMAGFDLPIRAIREQISMAVQFIVHQERMRDGKRRVTAITELVGMEGEVVTMQDIFRFEQERVDDEGRIIGSLVATGLRPQNFDNIVDHGVNLSMDLFQPRNMGGRDGDLRSRLDHRVNTR